ncbi:MAG TPA: hypothetical protein DEQ34_02725 [Balneolaceae bacterium]|nr:hypothetical protein [Balneolaceae bacterium]|tara:strand:- start:235304 stop:236155 length:852 start_codon:yes stop_codon:yes gene_type:complete
MSSRRDFILNSTKWALGVATVPYVQGLIKNKRKDMKIGVQVYSVRDLINDNFAEAMKQIADIGYDYIEAYGLGSDGKFLGSMTPLQYQQIIHDLGMEIKSTHTGYFTAEEANKYLSVAKEMKLQQLVIPYLSEELRGDYYTVAENLNAIGEKFREEGIRFGYHNHAFEFELTENGEIPLQILIENTDPGNVSFQMDIYWVKKAGFIPTGLFEKYPGRFTSYHIKDADKNLDQTTVGTGIIDFPKIFSKNTISGADLFFVEDERTNDPVTNLRNAYNYLMKIDF